MSSLTAWTGQRLDVVLGGFERRKVIVLLACVLGLASADAATVGAAAISLRHQLNISDTDIGLLVSVPSLLAALGSLPFGAAADRFRRTRILAIAIVAWGITMVWSATVSTFGGLLVTRLLLGFVTAAAGPIVASLVGDYFPSSERGRIYGYVLTGELLGAGLGFEVTGDVAAISWRAAFVILAIPAFVLARFVFRMPEPTRGGRDALIAIDSPPRVAERAPDLGPAMPTWTSHDDERLGFAPSTPGRKRESVETDAQRLARAQGIAPDLSRVLRRDPRTLKFFQAVRYILGIRTNVVLIVAGACGYYFLAGAQTFGMEFVRNDYGVSPFVAGVLILVVGAAAVLGVLVSGRVSDALLQRGRINSRILVSGAAAALTTVAFIPALLTHSALTAIPYILVAAFALGAQNPPIDAARLDIVPPLLWGRAEGVRTFLRTIAQAVAPTLFGAVSEYVFGGGGRHSGGSLRWTFIVMLVPLAANALILFKAMASYPRDVATAAVSTAAHADERGH